MRAILKLKGGGEHEPVVVETVFHFDVRYPLSITVDGAELETTTRIELGNKTEQP